MAARARLLKRMGGGERGGRSNASCWLEGRERSEGLCSEQCRQDECKRVRALSGEETGARALGTSCYVPDHMHLSRPVCACLHIFVERDARPVMSSLRRSSSCAAISLLREMRVLCHHMRETRVLSEMSSLCRSSSYAATNWRRYVLCFAHGRSACFISTNASPCNQARGAYAVPEVAPRTFSCFCWPESRGRFHPVGGPVLFRSREERLHIPQRLQQGQ